MTGQPARQSRGETGRRSFKDQICDALDGEGREGWNDLRMGDRATEEKAEKAAISGREDDPHFANEQHR